MSNRYEQSLKEQAARIRRELAGERETKPVERPKKEEREDRFVLTDVPSPIYGFQRPKQSVSETINTVDETENVDQVSDVVEEGITDEVASMEQVETVTEEVVLDETEADAGFVPVTDAELLVPELEADPDVEEDVASIELVDVEVSGANTREEEIPSVVVAIDESILSTEEPESLNEELTVEQEVEVGSNQSLDINSPVSDALIAESEKPTQSEVKKPVGPPVNVVMTTKDLMAMYRARREQNNLHGKK